MNNEQLALLQELVQQEAIAAVANNETDEAGYRGGAYHESNEAQRLFEKFRLSCNGAVEDRERIK